MAYTFPERRSTADVIFAQLRNEIMSLDILPGTKLSEAEVAAKFGVSRQPVREALNLLSREDLVTIQPQKATRVRKFSMQRIASSRFVRRAIEIEVLKIACEQWNNVYSPSFERSLAAQNRAVASHDTQAFQVLDQEFHERLTEVAQVPFAFERIKSAKAYVDRICVLSLKNTDEMAVLVADHQALFDCLSRQDARGAEVVLRQHLGRIENTIDAVRLTNAEYFED